MDKKKLILFSVWLPIIFFGVLNFLTVFTPEIGFDALWYHLALPKLWLLKHQWFFKGGLLYYSVMPRLTETIFIPLIHFTGFIGPKLVQYLSGIGVGYFIWKITSRQRISLLLKSVAVSLFYCTWLVSWQSGSAYVDLFRTLLETTALYFLITGSWKMGGIFLGLAVGTKWLSLGSVAIYALVFGAALTVPALILALPWFAVAYIFTGNPLYPILSPIITQSFLPISEAVRNILILPITVTFPYDDFISPLIGVLVVLSAISLFCRDKEIRKISLVGILGSVFSVSVDPPSSRFLLPYIPALIIASISVINTLKTPIRNIFVYLTVISSLAVFGMRCYAAKKYTLFLLGRESQNSFLARQSSRLPGAFIDSDNYIRDQVPGNSKILIDKLHNLYYFPYNFDHTSWVNNHEGYDYLITIGTNPQEIMGDLLHTNELGIQVYKLKK